MTRQKRAAIAQIASFVHDSGKGETSLLARPRTEKRGYLMACFVTKLFFMLRVYLNNEGTQLKEELWKTADARV